VITLPKRLRRRPAERKEMHTVREIIRSLVVMSLLGPMLVLGSAGGTAIAVARSTVAEGLNGSTIGAGLTPTPLTPVSASGRGVWSKAEEVPGTTLLNNRQLCTGPCNQFPSQVNSVSCPSAGNCSAGGYYSSLPYGEPFVVDETRGKWGEGDRGGAAVRRCGRWAHPLNIVPGGRQLRRGGLLGRSW
jgi:hypothetical protein